MKITKLATLLILLFVTVTNGQTEKTSISDREAVITVMKTYKDAIQKSDIIVFLVAHNEFREIEISSEKIVLDFCGINQTK